MVHLPFILAVSAEHAASSPSLDMPVPLYTGWATTVLLAILWLFVAAILLGPLVKYFKLEPVSTQLFADDRRGSRSH